MKSLFKFSYLEEFFMVAIQEYNFINLKDFFLSVSRIAPKTIVLRIDVDFDPLRVKNIADIFNKYDIKGTFFFRLHGKYNIFSFPVLIIIQDLIKAGHEIGIHTELVDMEKICNQDPEKLLRTSIKIFESLFNTKIYGTACHGDHTGNNNLDFWENKRSPQDFGLLYEAYDKNLFERGYYVSDSLVSRWKKYFHGKLDENGASDPLALIQEKNPEFVCMLLHPDSFFHQHY